MRHPLLYEINTRCWLRDLSGVGNRLLSLDEVPAAQFDQWQRLGVTHLWLMGVWTTGLLSRREALSSPDLRRVFDEVLPGWTEGDVGGSPYAVADYQVPAELGGDAGLARFRQRLNARGLKLILDFVPNHLGLDHSWVRHRPELFIQGPAGQAGFFEVSGAHGVCWLAHGKDPNFPPWTDTVQLDYRLPETRRAMEEGLLSLAARCDGVRCDMAMLVLNDVFAGTWKEFPASGSVADKEFWADAIRRVVGQHPGFMFLAEAYWGLEPRLIDQGFHYVYDKTLTDKLFARDAFGVQEHLLKLPPGNLAAGAHFLENHDELRVASRLSLEEHRAAALVILGLPGMRFLHEGQLSGWKRHLPVHLVRRQRETGDAAIEKMYRQLLTALPDAGVGSGRGELLTPAAAWEGNPTGKNFVLVQWQSQPGEFAVVAVNLAPHASQCRVIPTAPGLSEATWQMQDLLGQDPTRAETFAPGDGLRLDLPAHGTRLLRVARV